MEAYDLPDGVITVSHCTEDLSIGTLKLDPGAELDRHNRPVDEKLLQIQGSGGLRIFEDDGEEREVIFEEGDTFEIPADKDHQHINPSDEESIVIWKFEGDITGIIEDIREDFEEV
jgi:quercetin dioxygenase-like cupin family protein